MLISVDKDDVQHLYHTTMIGFVMEQPERFEIYKHSDHTIESDTHVETIGLPGGRLMWCGDNYLNASIVYSWYVGRDTWDAGAILWDLASDEWCVYLHYDDEHGGGRPALTDE